jgi:hypothetical protein
MMTTKPQAITHAHRLAPVIIAVITVATAAIHPGIVTRV